MAIGFPRAASARASARRNKLKPLSGAVWHSMLFGMLTAVDAVPSSQFHPAPSFMPGAATSPPESEGLQYRAKEPCPTFEGSYSRCGMEWDVWLMVDALLPSNATVMEFGARYGTTSCRLARATANSGYVVSCDARAQLAQADDQT